MGVNLVGQGATPTTRQPIYITNITPQTSGATSTQVSPVATNTFVPAGAYAVTINQHGNVSYGSSASGGYNKFVGINFTLNAIEADTGRVAPIYQTHTDQGTIALQNVYILPKDSIVSVSIWAPSTSDALTRYDVVLQPTSTPYTSYPTITPNTITAAATATSGSNSDINWGSVFMGWDYDNNHPFLLTTYNTAQRYSNWQSTQNNPMRIWRYSPSTGKWTFKQWNGLSAASGNTFLDTSGFYVHQEHSPSFFIKNNYMHNLTTFPIMQDVNSNAWGWIKTDLTIAGTTLSVEPGHTNTAFCTATANITTNNADARMMYYWDRVSAKVIYAGARSTTFNGTYGANNWRSYWGQWDIATNTIDYSNINSSTADPRSAGASANANLVYNTGVANAADGFIYAVVQNGTSEYNAKWNRSGTYTGVGSYLTYLPFTSSSSLSRSMYSTGNVLDYLPFNIAITARRAATVEYNTGASQPGLVEDSNAPFLNYTTPIYGNWGLTAWRQQILIMPQGIYVLNFSYGKFQSGDGSLRYTAVLTINSAPATRANIGVIIPQAGGISSQAYGVTGTNVGSW